MAAAEDTSAFEPTAMSEDFAGFEITPLSSSPCLPSIASPPEGSSGITLDTPCEECGHVGDVSLRRTETHRQPPDFNPSHDARCCQSLARQVMICLGDNRILCGRHHPAKGCMLRHCTQASEAHPCPLVMSFMDLSIWDYSQDAYLDMFNIVRSTRISQPASHTDLSSHPSSSSLSPPPPFPIPTLRRPRYSRTSRGCTSSSSGRSLPCPAYRRSRPGSAPPHRHCPGRAAVAGRASRFVSR